MPNKEQPLQFGRTLAFVGGGIGDVIMHTAHLQAIAKHSHNKTITLGCRSEPPIKDLFLGNDFVESVVGFGDGADNNRVIVSQARKKLAAGKYDTFISLKSNPRLVASAFLAGIPNRIGYMQSWDPRRLLLTQCAPVPKRTAHPLHMSKSDILLQKMGLSFDHATARLLPKNEALATAKTMLGSTDWIAVGINASVPQRQWGLNFAPLIKLLHAKTRARFLLFGGSDVRQVATEVIRQTELPDTCFLDLTAINSSLALSHAALSLCRLYVGNDSGGLNLAVMCGLPGIAFFTLAPPLTYSPLIIPISPDPAGSGVAGISVDRVLTTTMRTIEHHCSDLLVN